jgi:periplasmic protein CpxP/Spy
MNKILFLTIGVIFLFLLNAGMLVYLFKQRAHQDEVRGKGAAEYIIEQLQLDAQQQQVFAELLQQHRAITQKAQEEDRHLHDVYFTLLKTDHPDKAKADSVASLIALQRTAIEKATFEHFEKIRNLCRPAQKTLFDNTIDEIARHMAAPHAGPGGPGGPPPPSRNF